MLNYMDFAGLPVLSLNQIHYLMAKLLQIAIRLKSHSCSQSSAPCEQCTLTTHALPKLLLPTSLDPTSILLVYGMDCFHILLKDLKDYHQNKSLACQTMQTDSTSMKLAVDYKKIAYI